MRIKYLILSLLLLSSTSLIAQDKKDSKWTVSDIINTEYVRGASFSPDGNAIVWTKRRAFKEKDKFVSDIYLTRLDLLKDGMPRTFRLTNSDESDHSPIFSMDNESIYFLSSRDKGNKLWKMSVYGGEPEKVKEFKNGIRSINWLDENTIAYISHDGKTLYDEENKKDNTQIIDDSLHWRINKVYSYKIKDKTSVRLTNNTHPVSSYSVSKNGKYLVVRIRMSPHYGVDGQPKPRTYIYDLKSKTNKRILAEFQTPGSYQFTADNSGFYFTATTSSEPHWEGPGKGELYFYNIQSGKVDKVDLKWDKGVSGGYFVSGNDAIISLANNTTRKLSFYRKVKSGWLKQPLDFGAMNDHVSMIAISDKGDKLAFNYSTASRLPQFNVVSIEKRKKDIRVGQSTEFVKLNKNLKKRSITRSEVMKWIGAKDEEVDGILYYPENYEAGKKYPLVLSIHGGPTGTDNDTWSERWSTYPQIMAQRGSFVLKPNYHGSGNHGQEFAESIKGHYYNLEEIDIINGINVLNGKGMIDMDKLGVMGWSNGAILATWLTLQYPDMFNVCAAGAGDVNWSSDYGTCAFGVTFDQYYFRGAPWDDIDGKTYNETYIIKSPLFEIEKIKTPTIIFHGSEDRSVPRDQGWEYYRGLQQVGIAPVRFLWFPGQPHGLQKITHQTRKMKEELVWFDTYLFETYEPKNEAFKKESPLANLLSFNETVKMKNGQYGVVVNGKLTPQMVLLGEDTISIALFETTNAQVKAILPDFNFENGKDNYPAAGLLAQQIEDYLDKLTEVTGVKYRLPNETEAKALHKKAFKSASKENSLNYWAGYDLTPSDAGKLKRKLVNNGSMIMEVGKFKPTSVGKDGKIYDLGGNVAEYYNTANGNSYGYSAYDFVDNFSKDVKPQPEHIGFRVVKE